MCCAKLRQAAPAHPCARGIPFILNISESWEVNTHLSVPFRADKAGPSQACKSVLFKQLGQVGPISGQHVFGHRVEHALFLDIVLLDQHKQGVA